MNRIAELRKERGLSQKELASAIGVHQTSVSQWETGKTNPDFGSLCDLCSFFDLSIDYVMGYSSERKRNNMTEEEMDALAADLVEEELSEMRELTLRYMRQLDYEGQQKVKDYAADILGNPKYKMKD